MTIKHELTQGELDTLTSEFVGVEGTEIRTDYSGRGMWGDECLAYVGPEPALFVFDLARVLTEADGADPDDAEEVRQRLADLMPWRTDSLGKNTVYYWPWITVAVDLALLEGADQ